MIDSELEFQDIYDTFRPRIFRYLTRLVGDHEAEDLAQEVFVKISQGLETFRGESKLSTWIYRVATNSALDRLRSPSFRQSQKSVTSDLTEEREEGQEIWIEDKTPSVDQQLIQEEMNECIRNFIDTLPENYRTVIALSELKDLKNNEIAEILGISLETVKIRLYRARARLKKELETHCSFYRDERNELACDRKGSL